MHDIWLKLLLILALCVHILPCNILVSQVLAFALGGELLRKK
jgi:hypothetical protein